MAPGLGGIRKRNLRPARLDVPDRSWPQKRPFAEKQGSELTARLLQEVVPARAMMHDQG